MDPGPGFDDVMTAVYVAVGDNKIAVAHRINGEIKIYDFSGNLEYSHTDLHGALTLSSVAIGDGKVAVGSQVASSSTGIVYVYNIDGTGQTIIQASEGITYRSTSLEYKPLSYRDTIYLYQVLPGGTQIPIKRQFGSSITIGDGKIAISAPGEIVIQRRYVNSRWRNQTMIDPNSVVPAVYIYDLDGTNEVKINQVSDDTHNEIDERMGTTTTESDFGSSMSILNGKIAIGSGKENVPVNYYSGDGYNNTYYDYRNKRYRVTEEVGSVYIYNLDGTNGKRLKDANYELGLSDDNDYDEGFRYGASVALSTDGKLVVGALGMELDSLKEFNLSAGLAFVYDMNEIENAPMDRSAGDIKFMSGLSETVVSASDQVPPITSGKDAIMIKYNSSGALQWLRKYDSGQTGFTADLKEDIGSAMTIDDSDNVYAIVQQKYTGKNYIIKQDTSGSIIWQRSFKLQYTGARGLTHIVGAESQSQKTYNDIYVDYSSDRTIWKSSQLTIRSQFLTVDSSSNIVIALELGGYYTDDDITSKIVILKYDSSGNLLWSRSIGHGRGGRTKTGEEKPTGVKTDNAGNIYICGSTASFGPDFDTTWLTDRHPKYRGTVETWNDPQSSFIIKLPGDGSMTGDHSGLPYNQNIEHNLYSVVSSDIQVVTDLSESSIVELPDTFIHGEGQLVSARSYMLHDVSASVRNVKLTFNSPSSQVYGSSGNTITITDQGSTWSVGDNFYTEYAMEVIPTIDPDDPSTLVLVASAPAVTRGSVNWGLAEWQLAEDPEFTKNLQTITEPLNGTGAQTGPSGFTLSYQRGHYVRVRYLSDDQPDVFSEWSEVNTFRTTAD